MLLSASTPLCFGWAQVAGWHLSRKPSNLGQRGSARFVQPEHSLFSPLMRVLMCGCALGMPITAAKTEPKPGPKMDDAQPVILPSKSPTFPQRKSSRLLVLRGSAEQWVIMSASVASFLHMMYSHHLPSLSSYQKQHGMQAEQRKNQPTPSTPSTRAERLLLTADGCA